MSQSWVFAHLPGHAWRARKQSAKRLDILKSRRVDLEQINRDLDKIEEKAQHGVLGNISPNDLSLQVEVKRRYLNKLWPVNHSGLDAVLYATRSRAYDLEILLTPADQSHYQPGL